MTTNFLVRNKEQAFLGNSPVFWAKNNSGYTQWIDEARVFTQQEADELVAERKCKWEKFEVEKVFSIAKRTIDIQDWSKLNGN